MSRRTLDEKKLAFVAFCIEEYKTEIGSTGGKVVDYFKKLGVIDYLMEFYDVLHSMSRKEILADIEKFIKNRSKQ